MLSDSLHPVLPSQWSLHWHLFELSGGFCFLWELQVTLFFSEDPCMLAQSCRYTRVAGLLGSQAALGAFCH